ncbi:MAG: alpha-L-fucosidase [Sedimentisphaerales bacterium]|nr:alpha-L-fucosidase [Sedimentisphaerales bacterium]
MKTTNLLFLSMFFLVLPLSLRAQSESVTYKANWDSLDQRPTPQWFLDAKFGIFIHWGLYSVPAWGEEKAYAEWYWRHTFNDDGTLQKNNWGQFHQRVYGKDFQYADFVPKFNCEMFNPDQWADIFARAGARYVVLTSKHHDGFCLWPSKQANQTWGRLWNSVDAGPQRDLLGDLTVAVRKKNIKMGFYYSLYEWFNPLWRFDRQQYVSQHMWPQFKDVVTRYQPSIIFSDGEWDLADSDWRTPELLAWLFNESPCKDEVVINDRWGKGIRHKHGGYYTTEYGAGLSDTDHPWEENRGMGHSFGYNRNEPLSNYKTTRELILLLVDLVSRGGNLLLDIGPTADGRIPEIMQLKLIEMGQWLNINGQAIYATRPHTTPCQWSAGKKPEQTSTKDQAEYNLMDRIGKPENDKAVIQAFFTTKPGVLYAITPGWPGKKLLLRDLNLDRVSDVVMLGFPDKIAWKKQDQNLILDLSKITPDQLPCPWAYTFKITYEK